MQATGTEVLLAAVDADTLIVAAVLQLARNSTSPVEAQAEDTDFLAMLLHHCNDSVGILLL
jgi:hypothetical protein